MNTIKQEQRILRALVDNLAAAGFQPAAVWIGGEYVMPLEPSGNPQETDQTVLDQIARPMSAAEILKIFEDYDLSTPTVHFTHQHLTTWGNRGVMVVPGNGCDFISDWHCGDAAFNAIVDQVATAASEEVYA